ncbi:hypothetical protein [Salinispora arenicola]|uniref:hypothetical protein n=1 Tax=Salinispora arenicola TaxID=168697 RepID=UPI0009B779B3|nr:hypothetical protein [Salinispora arenicola]
MKTLALTTERRNELAALLDDERRLRAEYPKVAEYMVTSPMLPGTDDAQADAEFELRILHYMTSSKERVQNPYWEILAPSVFEHDGRRVVNGGSLTGSGRLAYAETLLQAAYAYAIPSPETLEWIAGFCADRPVVELGAGRGYWASQLSNCGVVIDAFDAEPPDRTNNVSFDRSVGQLDSWYQIGDLKDFEERVRDRSDHVLFLCWPPGWGNTMASWALTEFEKAGGSRLVFIGEPCGGKTGDDAFFDGLDARWNLESEDTQFVSWWNLRDVAQGWTRR